MNRVLSSKTRSHLKTKFDHSVTRHDWLLLTLELPKHRLTVISGKTAHPLYSKVTRYYTQAEGTLIRMF